MHTTLIYNICMTKHSHFPYTSTYSSTPHNTTENTTSITSTTQTHNILQHCKAKNPLSSTTDSTQRPLHNGLYTTASTQRPLHNGLYITASIQRPLHNGLLFATNIYFKLRSLLFIIVTTNTFRYNIHTTTVIVIYLTHNKCYESRSEL